jgi:hypothetical protein
MFQILAYGADNAAGATLVDTPAIADPAFVTQNGHWIFYEDYELDAVFVNGASLTAAQLFDSTWNSLNVQQLDPVNLSAGIPGNPQIAESLRYPVQIPQNEQVALQLSNNLAMASEYEFGILFISPAGQARNVPSPAAQYGNKGRIKALFTVTTALTAGVWSADSLVVVPNLIKGGTYCVAGVQLYVGAGIAVRCNFPRAPLYQGRKLYPGALTSAAYGNVPQKEGRQWMGPFGYFDTTEFFQVSVLANGTVGSATYTGFLDLVYMGQALIGQGGMTPM